MWNEQVDYLSRSYRIIAPDLPGFGHSPWAPKRGAGTADEALTMEALADSLAKMLDALGIHEPIVFCGFSMGGYIAWQFYRQFTDRLRGLILCNTRAAADNSDQASSRLKMAERVAEWGTEPVAKAMLPNLFAPTTFQNQPVLTERIYKMIVAAKPRTIAAALSPP